MLNGQHMFQGPLTPWGAPGPGLVPRESKLPRQYCGCIHPAFARNDFIAFTIASICLWLVVSHLSYLILQIESISFHFRDLSYALLFKGGFCWCPPLATQLRSFSAGKGEHLACGCVRHFSDVFYDLHRFANLECDHISWTTTPKKTEKHNFHPPTNCKVGFQGSCWNKTWKEQQSPLDDPQPNHTFPPSLDAANHQQPLLLLRLHGSSVCVRRAFAWRSPRGWRHGRCDMMLIHMAHQILKHMINLRKTD